MRKWTITFVLACVLSIAVVLLALWAAGGFEELGLGLPGAAALVLGIGFTVAVGIGLMALVFASNRSAKDEEVHHVQQQKR